MNTLLSRLAVLGLLAFSASAKSLENTRGMRDRPDPRCPVRSINLNAIRACLDGQWQGIVAASDGRVYFACSTHSGRNGGSVFRYDPASDQLETLVADITRACGEDPEVNPQGKMHSDFIEHQGWIYFATHFSSEFPGARNTYAGAHVLGLEMKTGKTRDFGVAYPGYTIYSGIGVDPVRNRIYTLAMPITRHQASMENGGTRMIVFDIATGNRRDLGVINTEVHDSSSSLFVDARGDCWFTLRSDPGCLYRIRGDTLAMDRHPGAMPPAGALPWEQARCMIWSRPIGDGTRCILLTGDRWLREFDPARPLNEAFTRLAEVGPAGLGTALAGDRVYFVRSADLNGRAGRYFDKCDDHHLYSVSLSDRTVTDHGLIEDGEGRRPWRIHSVAADAAGRVYMTGDWYCTTATEGMRRYAGEKDGKPVFRQLMRGQFFAVWRPDAPPSGPSAAPVAAARITRP